MPLEVVETQELDKPEYARNDANRCFHCKDELFATMKALGGKLGFAAIAYGMNAMTRRIIVPDSGRRPSTRFWLRLPRPV